MHNMFLYHHLVCFPSIRQSEPIPTFIHRSKFATINDVSECCNQQTCQLNGAPPNYNMSIRQMVARNKTCDMLHVLVF